MSDMTSSSTPSADSELRKQIEKLIVLKDPENGPMFLEDVLGTEDAIDFYNALMELVAAHLEAAVRSAKAEAYGDACYWATDKRMSKADIAEVCLTRRRVLLGEIEEPKSRFKLHRTPASESENSDMVQQSNQGDA